MNQSSIQPEKEAKAIMQAVEKCLKDPLIPQDPKTQKMLRDTMKKVLEEGKTLGEAFDFSQDDLVTLYTFGYKLFESGKYKDAFLLFQMLSVFFPMNGALSLAMGTCHQRMKNWESAIEQYLVAAHLDKGDPIPYYYCYECYVQLEEPLYAGMMLRCVIDRCGDIPSFQAIKAKSELMLERVNQEAAKQKKPGKITEKMDRVPHIWNFKKTA